MTLAKKQLSKAWTDEDSFATTMLMVLIDKYGTEALEWAPQTLVMEIEEDYGVDLPKPNVDRLMTAIDILTSDNFYNSLPDFINQCNILSGDTYDPRVWDPADAGEIAWGITEALLIEPPDGEDPFSEEIRAYIGATLDVEGIIQPPDVLKIAIRDAEDLVGQISGEFSDDPAMFGAIYEFENAKTQDINQYVKSNLLKLANQLEQLPLRIGSTAGVVQKVFQTLK
jgi:hypothetical protein